MTKNSPLCPFCSQLEDKYTAFCSQLEDKYTVHAHSIPKMNILIAEKYIPIEKIDEKIAELQLKWKTTCEEMYTTHFTKSIDLTSDEKIELGAIPTVIKILEGLKK